MHTGLIRKLLGGLSIAILASVIPNLASASPTTPLKSLPRNKVLYYTFDDGPHPSRTATVLDALKAHGVPATFFVIGSQIKGNEKILQRQAAEGHLIGSHQWDHVIFKDPVQFRDQIVRTRDGIKAVVGDKQPLYFRYPYGATAPWKEQILKEEGYADGGAGWHIDSLDWAFAGNVTASRPEIPANLKADYQGWVMYHANKVGGGILLHHDIKLITGQKLDAELTALKAAGYSFAALPQ